MQGNADVFSPPKLSEDEEHLSGGPGITISHHASIALLSVHELKTTQDFLHKKRSS